MPVGPSGKSFGLTYMYIQMHKKNQIKKSKNVPCIQIYQATKHDTNSLPSSMLQDSRTLSQVCKSAVVGNHASGWWKSETACKMCVLKFYTFIYLLQYFSFVVGVPFGLMYL